MTDELIQAEKANYSTRMMCKALGVSRAGLYRRQAKPLSDRKRADLKLATQIRLVHRTSKARYGSPRVHAELRATHGVRVGRKRVERLMREMGVRGRHPKRFRRTTDSKHGRPVAPNVLGRDFCATRPNEVWVSDITYLRVGSGFAYLAVVLDLYSRRVVGWSLSDSLESSFAVEALMTAVVRRRPERGLIHHADRGVQYTSGAYRSALAAHGFEESMSRKGDCWDNAVAESFFATLEKELESERSWPTLEAARSDLFQYIEDFYNRTRRHSTLNYATPIDIEQRWREEGRAAA